MSAFDKFIIDYVVAAQELDAQEKLRVLDRTKKAVQMEQDLGVFQPPAKEVRLNKALLSPTSAARGPQSQRSVSIGMPPNSQKSKAATPQKKKPVAPKVAAAPRPTQDDAFDTLEQLSAVVSSIENAMREEEWNAMKSGDAEEGPSPAKEGIDRDEEDEDDAPKELDETTAAAPIEPQEGEQQEDPEAAPVAADEEKVAVSDEAEAAPAAESAPAEENTEAAPAAAEETAEQTTEAAQPEAATE